MPKSLILGWLPGANRPSKRQYATSVTKREKHLKLAVDVGSDPITGSVAVGPGAPTSFCGWIELVAAIEAVRHDSALVVDQILETNSLDSGQRPWGTRAGNTGVLP